MSLKNLRKAKLSLDQKAIFQGKIISKNPIFGVYWRNNHASAKKKLTIVWFSGSGVLFLLVLLQTIFGKYLDKVGEAWAWLLPTFMPTLSLIVGVLVADSLGKNENKDASEPPTADQFVFHLSFSLSIAYLLVVVLTILLSPFFEQAAQEKTIFDLMKLSNLWLAPFKA